MDVCGAPALTARVVRRYVADGRPPVVAVIGGGRQVRLPVAGRRATRPAPGAPSASCPHEAEARRCCARPGSPTRWRSPTPATRSPCATAVDRGRAGPPTSPSSASTCPAASTARSWPPPRAAPSSSSRWPPRSRAAALGAEGLAADVTMLVGNGYVPGHADYALDLLRAEPGVRGLFERPAVMDADEPPGRRASSTSTRRPSARRARWPARPARRSSKLARSTPPSRSSAPRCAWPGSPAPTPTASRGSTGWSTPSAADVGLEHGVALPVWDALRPRRGRRPARRSPRRPPPARCRSGCPRAATPTRAGAAAPASRSGAGITPHRRAPRASASGWSSGIGDAPRQAVDLPDRRHRRHLRGHPAGPGRPPARAPTSSR